jgi:hypothetical protein
MDGRRAGASAGRSSYQGPDVADGSRCAWFRGRGSGLLLEPLEAFRGFGLEAGRQDLDVEWHV